MAGCTAAVVRVWLCELSLQRFPGDEGGQRETPPPLKFLVVVISIFVCLLLLFVLFFFFTLFFRDLNIKRVFDSRPVLWSLLQLISDPLSANEPSALVCCAPVIRSLMTVLTQHWQRCCMNSPSKFPWELENTVVLVECLAKV